MSFLTQAHRHVAIHTPLGPDVLTVRRMVGTEQLSRPFEYQVDLLSRDYNVDFDRILGFPVAISLDVRNHERRYFHGYVSHFVQKPSPDGRRLATYQAKVVPWLWFLTRKQDCRIFQDMSVPRIIKEVFRANGFNDIKDLLTGDYRTWEYCVQYRESDFNFVSRLMEHEGIYYYFEHEHNKHSIVLCDGYNGHGPFAGYEAIPYYPPGQTRLVPEHISAWKYERQVQPGIVTMTDYDFKVPRKNLVSAVQMQRHHAGGNGEWFDYPGTYTDFQHGEAYTRIRAEEFDTQFETISGEADARGIAPGHLFTLADFPRLDQNRQYLVTSASYVIESDEFDSSDDDSRATVDILPYTVSFSAIDAKRIFRPARLTPKPFVQGPQTAVVTGPASKEIYTDKYGRVKVHFHWDRHNSADARSSCWMRVSMPFAGKGWGGVQIPRIGQEVIVDFLEGDPDQPIITGRVYNGDTMPPLSGAGRPPGTPPHQSMEQAAHQMTLKSNSLGGSGGHNEITMNDMGGQETLYIRAQKDETHEVLHDRKDTVGNDEVSEVRNNRTDTVGNDETRTVNNNRTRTVGVNETITVNANRSLTVQANQTTTINQNRMSTVAVANNDMTGVIRSVETGVARVDMVGMVHADIVGLGRVSVVGLQDYLKVLMGGKTDDIATTYKITAGTDFIVEAKAKAGIKAASMLVIECPDITLKAGGGFIRIDASGVTIVGKKVKINSGGSPGSLDGATAAAAASSSSSSSSGTSSAPKDLAPGAGTSGAGPLDQFKAMVTKGFGGLDSFGPILKAIPPGILPPGVAGILGPLADGQMPGLDSLMGAIPPGVLPPGLQGTLGSVTQAFGAAADAFASPSPQAAAIPGDFFGEPSEDICRIDDPSVTTGLGRDVDVGISVSDVFVDKIMAVQQQGYVFEYGTAGAGTYCDKQAQRIVVDSQQKGNTSEILESVAHEVGHAGYKAGSGTSWQDPNRQNYIDTNTNELLKDEGEATLTNAEIARDLKAHGVTIGIAGANANTYEQIAAKVDSGTLTRDQGRQQIANIFKNNEHPSTDPSETYGQHYGSYYEQDYDAWYHKAGRWLLGK